MSDLISHRVDLERALLDPPSCFDTPHDVLCSPELSQTQKIEILCRWAYDARELAVAEEEGMGGGDNTNNLDAVVAALNSLVGSVDVEHSAPTKHAASCVRPHSPTVLSSKGTTLKALGLLSVAAGTMWLAQSARASAFAIQEQSASALSRALAVTISTPDDPSIPPSPVPALAAANAD